MAVTALDKLPGNFWPPVPVDHVSWDGGSEDACLRLTTGARGEVAR